MLVHVAFNQISHSPSLLHPSLSPLLCSSASEAQSPRDLSRWQLQVTALCARPEVCCARRLPGNVVRSPAPPSVSAPEPRAGWRRRLGGRVERGGACCLRTVTRRPRARKGRRASSPRRPALPPQGPRRIAAGRAPEGRAAPVPAPLALPGLPSSRAGGRPPGKGPAGMGHRDERVRGSHGGASGRNNQPDAPPLQGGTRPRAGQGPAAGRARPGLCDGSQHRRSSIKCFFRSKNKQLKSFVSRQK